MIIARSKPRKSLASSPSLWLLAVMSVLLLQGCRTREFKLREQELIKREWSLPATDTKPKTAVLLIHGIDGTPMHMLPFANAAVEAGYSARIILLPGHCGSGQELRDATAEQWWQKVEQEYDALAATHDQVHVVGFSLGAALALHLCEVRPVQHAFLLAPPVKLATEKWFSPEMIRKAGTYIQWVPVMKSHTKIQFEGESYRVPINYHHFVPSAALMEADRVIQKVTANLSAIQAELYLLHAAHDTVIDVSSIDIISEAVGPEKCTKLILPSFRHSMFLEDEREASQEAFEAFLTSLEFD